MKKVKNAPTPEQIDYFFKQVKHFQNLLNLNDWRIERGARPAAKGCAAEVETSMEDRLATVRVGADWGSMPINEKTLKETGAHEVIHVFLKPLIEACISRDPIAIATAEHSVVVILEKVLTGDV